MATGSARWKWDRCRAVSGKSVVAVYARRIGWAPCSNVRIVLKSVVNEAPLVGIHRFKLKRTTRDANAVSQFSHTLDDAIFAHGTIVFAIYDDLFSVFVSGLQQPVKQKLDGLERLAVASNKAPAFLGVNLQRRIATFIGGFLDLHNETEKAEHGVEQIFRRHHRFRFPAGATFSSVGTGCRLF